MDLFIENISLIKRMFVGFPVELQLKALGIFEETLNCLSYEYDQNVSKENGLINNVLAENAEQMIIDRFGGEWFGETSTDSQGPSTSQDFAVFGNYETDESCNFYHHENSDIQIIRREEDFQISNKCFTCGLKLGNRKALYRHGIRSGHQTRQKRAPIRKGGTIKCRECEYTTCAEEYLKRHQRRFHNIYKSHSEIPSNNLNINI